MTMTDPAVTELVELEVDQVDGVTKGANGFPFLVLKALEDDVAKAEEDIPSSPAWEAVDAAGAKSAIDQLVQLRESVAQLLARENTEGAMGDEDAWSSMWQLSGVDDALDCALTALARYAVDEAAEAAEPVVEVTLSPSMADLGPDVMKAGRRLSAATQTSITEAIATLNAVLDGTLTTGQAPAKEDDMSTETTTTDNADTATAEPVAKATEPETAPVVEPVTPAPVLDTAQVIKSLSEPDVMSVLKSALGDVVKEGLAAALKPLEDRLSLVENTPVAGGPVLKGRAASTTAADWAAMVAPRRTEEEDSSELAAVVKALADEVDPGRQAVIRTKFAEAQMVDFFKTGKPPITLP